MEASVRGRGRPAGRMTIAGRKVMGYVLRQQAKAEPIIIGEMVRVCGFSCPANAKRTLRRLKEIGAIDFLNRGEAVTSAVSLLNGGRMRHDVWSDGA